MTSGRPDDTADGLNFMGQKDRLQNGKNAGSQLGKTQKSGNLTRSMPFND
jgi:hypothetical protein